MAPVISRNRRVTHQSTYRDETDTACIANAVSSTTGGVSTLTLDDILIVSDKYKYPIEDFVPDGYYHSRVAKIDIRTKAGPNGENKVLIDVCYDIEGYDYKNRGQTYGIKQSYCRGSDYLQEFYDAMIAAGVEPDTPIRNAIGVRENIVLAYCAKNSDIGSIVRRSPFSQAVTTSAADDEEFDAYLEDDT